MSQMFLGNKVIDLSPRKIKKVSNTLLKTARARANKEYKYLIQFNNPIDAFVAGTWKNVAETITKELNKRKLATEV